MQKLLTFFQQKYKRIFNDEIFNDTLTNNIIIFQQAGTHRVHLFLGLPGSSAGDLREEFVNPRSECRCNAPGGCYNKGKSSLILTHFRLNNHPPPHTIYWKSQISVLGMSGYVI